MKLFEWLTSLMLGGLRRKQLAAPKQKGRLNCSECGGGIHRHDRYVILAARHRDCGDPKLVGQRVLIEAGAGRLTGINAQDGEVVGVKTDSQGGGDAVRS